MKTTKRLDRLAPMDAGGNRTPRYVRAVLMDYADLWDIPELAEERR